MTNALRLAIALDSVFLLSHDEFDAWALGFAREPRPGSLSDTETLAYNTGHAISFIVDEEYAKEDAEAEALAAENKP